MKRFASNYVYIPEAGFLKKCIVEINQSKISAILPFINESEAVIWYPGLLVLIPHKEDKYFNDEEETLNSLVHYINNSEVNLISELFFLDELLHSKCSLLGYFPFDFANMLPVGTTRCEVLI